MSTPVGAAPAAAAATAAETTTSAVEVKSTALTFQPFDFKYTHAIVCRVPNTIKESARKIKDLTRMEPINADLAKEQHNEYIAALRKLGLDVIELQADDTLPDSAFVDSIALIVNGIALMAKPHMVSRKKEVDIIRSVLRKEGLCIVDITDEAATIDTSDVLFTGREFFVGLSKRTNIVGAKAVAAAFPEFPVSLIKVKKGLQLKAYVCMAGPDLVAIGSSEIAKDVLRQMKDIAEYRKYQVITIPDVNYINCIFANNTLLHCSREESNPCAQIFASKIDFPRIELKNREFMKLDHYLTCRSLLFTKKRVYALLASAYVSSLTALNNNTQDTVIVQHQVVIGETTTTNSDQNNNNVNKNNKTRTNGSKKSK